MSNRKTILIVDENKTVTLFLGIVLKRMGFGVEQANSGRDALKVLKTIRPDLILMQVVMSSYTGVDALRAIRKETKLNDTPVIMMTTEPDDKLIQRCAEFGSNGFLAMPVKMEELHGILQEFVLSTAGFRRRHMRVNANIKVMVYKDGATSLFSTVVISEGGMYLRAEKPLPVLSEVGISIPSPDRELKLNGLVIYHGGGSTGSDVPPGMAIEFVGLTEKDSASLKLLVNRLMTGDMDTDTEAFRRFRASSPEEGMSMRHRSV